MYKFEYNHVEAKSYLMLPKNRYLISSPRPQIKVTVISQVEFGDPELTYSIYCGKLKKMYRECLKTNAKQFHSSLTAYLSGKNQVA